ncbi:hypothetical protein Val02_28570 [Virgisporangium aliadipatigenens]|uniref:Uncharacterized protein n=1 Tax=Virgisporangium aliadipatigenens TaxID=741659 RepID=A0A8J4DQG9_9ACTN|nr:hypothetical protein [Virgisporangium aliadipatigenens]GIJ45971.1 hypothetical protein Val02_28570 [Virgisporangium aliadipatigenens]
MTTSEFLDDEDIARMERYVRDMRRRRALGQAISRADFAAWASHAAAWLLDRLEDAWDWVRRALGLV